jgi:cytochrome c-type biogenesis protein CcmH/NrfG
MMLTLVGALALAAALQSGTADRSRAEDLARTGRTVEAMELFTHIVEANPADVEARLWVARLALRLGRTADAETGFREVLKEHPDDVDARIGLGMALTRAGAWQDALTILTGAERDAGQNADLFAALARAYRRGGDDRQALAYFERAKALSPADPDIALGYEAVARIYGHWISVAGFTQSGAPDAGLGSGAIVADVRVLPRLHLEAAARTQRGSDYSDTVAGGGFLWRAVNTTTVSFHALGGTENVVLPRVDLYGDATHYAGTLEFGAGIRTVSFADSSLIAVSPVFAWDRDRWRLDARYTLSRSAFDASVPSINANSVLVRETWQARRRVALLGSYAYGIESFDTLTADRLRLPGASTAAAGLRVDLTTLTRITATWEHQWRSDDTTLDRVTVSVVQVIP